MKVFTFYSFKGGVGRTALMLHLGVHWADRGRVVALVDMDLQAPGLSYHPWLAPPDTDDEYQQLGVSDLLATFYETRNVEERTFKFFSPSRALREMRPEGRADNKWGSNGRLLVLPAGDVTIPQLQVVEGGDLIPIPSARATPDEPLEQEAMRAFSHKFLQDFENFRLADHPRKAGIDYLMIDCRTGYPELAELALGYLADRLVLVSGLNEQNLHGLDTTLQRLRPGRVPVPEYASQMLVAFSPVPAHIFEDPVGRDALARGVKILEKHRDHGDKNESGEALPPYFTLPYTPHLAVSELPVSRERLLGKLHPYWEAVEQVAASLDPPPKTIQESTREILRQTQDALGLTERGAEREVGDGSSSRASLAPMLRLPRWHWPLEGDQGRIDAWLKKYPIHQELEVQREQLLDGLCASVSLGIDVKARIIQDWGALSQSQLDALLGILQEEKTNFSAIGIADGHRVLSHLFKKQKEWAEFVLGREAGRQGFRIRPLREERLFAPWKKYSSYWFLLAEALKEEPAHPDLAEEARQRAIAVAKDNPWETIATLDDDHDVDRDLAEQLLDLILHLHNFSNDRDLCMALCGKVLSIWGGSLAKKITPIVDHLSALAPDWEWTHLICGNFFLTTGSFDQSEAAFRQAVAIQPEFGRAWNNLGVVRGVLGRYADAEAAYREAIAVDRENVLAWNNLGELLRDRLGRCREAMDVLSEGLSLDSEDSNFPIILVNRGHLRILLGYQEWREDLDLALAKFSKTGQAGALYHRTLLSLELGKKERLPSEDEVSHACAYYGGKWEVPLAAAWRELAMGQGWSSPHLEQTATLLRSHEDQLNVMSTWYYLAGARPDLCEVARAAATFFFHLGQEHTSRLQGEFHHDQLEKFRDFVEGRSDGAGDPRDRHRFCHDGDGTIQGSSPTDP